ncbi:MAG: metalloregulator ArsR/SmtB family transcription factor [Trueperaceae bacterium]|nr:metalloregulator ArsR/SmtB family transcription factor [Trueperaceae bacterium]
MTTSTVLSALADPTRFAILEFLAAPVQSQCRHDDGVCGCDLEAFLGLSQPTVSHHMKRLVEAGVVRAAREGRWVHYELDAEALRVLAGTFERFARAADARAGEGVTA